jgi:hypothetical protein
MEVVETNMKTLLYDSKYDITDVIANAIDLVDCHILLYLSVDFESTSSLQKWKNQILFIWS